MEENCGDEIKFSTILKEIYSDAEEAINMVNTLKKNLNSINDAIMPLVFQTIFSEIRSARLYLDL